MPSTIARTTRRSRMLAAVALLGAAALVAGCASGDTDPGATMTPGVTPGAEPVPLDDARLPGLDVFEGIQESAIAVRWATPGESLAVIVGGSGSGGECIPQPHEAGLDPSGPTIIVRFDPPNPEAMCTMDFRLHGWELVLPEPIDPSAIVPVQLVNTSDAGETIEVELGPDDLLDAGPTADPQPSEIPDAGGATAPRRIPEGEIPEGIVAGDGSTDDAEALTVLWAQPGASLAVFLFANSAPECLPEPVAARGTGPGSLALTFEPPPIGHDCAAIGEVVGWQVQLDAPVGATLPVEVVISGLSHDDSQISRTIEPDAVFDGA